MLPVINEFKQTHGPEDVTVVVDAGMISSPRRWWWLVGEGAPMPEPATDEERGGGGSGPPRPSPHPADGLIRGRQR